MDARLTTLKLGSVNAYLLRAQEGFVLIDSGLPWQWQRLRAALEWERCVPGSLRLMLLTHGDIDHCGNCASVRSEYGAPVAIHEADAAQVETGIPLKRESPTLVGKGMLSLGAAIFAFRRHAPLRTFSPDVLLNGGESLEEYGLEAEVLHLPGHTSGSIAVLNQDGSLFSGDTFLNFKHVHQPLQNLEDYRSSLQKIRPLLPRIRTVYPGHGKSFGVERLSQIRL